MRSRPGDVGGLLYTTPREIRKGFLQPCLPSPGHLRSQIAKFFRGREEKAREFLSQYLARPGVVKSARPG